MAEETKDENKNEDSSSSLEGAIASSPEALEEAQQSQETQTPPAQEGETQEQQEQQAEGKIPYDRFKEVNDEKNWYKQQLEKLVAQQQAPQPSSQQQPQTPPDPYAGMTPEEQAFWRNVDMRAEQKAKQIIQQTVSPQLKAGIEEVARLRVLQFRRDHPDVKPDSPEEAKIAQKVQQGYLPDDAYRSVMWDKITGKKQMENIQQQQQKLETKKKANVVSSQSVSRAAAPSAGKETYEEEMARRMNTEWDGTL